LQDFDKYLTDGIFYLFILGKTKEDYPMINKIIANILIPLILLHGMGCYSYKSLKVDDAQKTDKIEKAKITTINDKTYTLTDVTIEESQVKGFIAATHMGWVQKRHGEEILIPLEEIKKIEVDYFNQSKTTVTIILGIVALSFLVVLILRDSHPLSLYGDFNLK